MRRRERGGGKGWGGGEGGRERGGGNGVLEEDRERARGVRDHQDAAGSGLFIS